MSFIYILLHGSLQKADVTVEFEAVATMGRERDYLINVDVDHNCIVLSSPGPFDCGLYSMCSD